LWHLDLRAPHRRFEPFAHATFVCALDASETLDSILDAFGIAMRTMSLSRLTIPHEYCLDKDMAWTTFGRDRSDSS
jgi:hypothetical protein